MAGFSNGALTVNDAATSRTNLGLGTTDSPTFSTVTATTQVLANYLSSTAANTDMSIGAGYSGADTATLTLYTNGIGNILLQSAANTSASAIDLVAFTGGISLQSGANKDITLATSGTGKVSATSMAATTFTGALTGNASTATTLQTSRNINGVAFNGSADVTIPVNTTSSTTNAAFFPLFVSSSSNGNQSVNLGTGLTFNPSTNTLGTSIMKADSFRNYTTNPTTVSLSNTGTSTNSASIYISSSAGGITLEAITGMTISPGSGQTLAVNGKMFSTGAFGNSTVGDGDKCYFLGSSSYARIAHGSGWNLQTIAGATGTANSGQFAWYTSDAGGTATSRMTLGNTGDLTITGKITATGATFTNSTSGYVAGTLDFYEKATALSATSSGAVTQTFTAKITRIGNVVTMIWPDFNWTTGSAATLTVTSLVPARFRPTATVNLNYFMKNFGTNSVSTFSISSAGTAVFGCNSTGGSFSSGTSSFAIYGGCQSWTID